MPAHRSERCNHCLSGLFFALIGLFAVPKPLYAGEPSLTREVLVVSDENAPIRPAKLEVAADGGVIVTGSAGFDGWAVKMTASGKESWTYKVASQRGLPRPRTTTIVGAIPMPDDSTYLCVERSLPYGAGPGSSLVHLDPSGKLLSEKFFSPSIKKGSEGGGTFFRCGRWENGLVVVGTAGTVMQKAAPGVPMITKLSYWVLALDASADIRWERQIPIGIKSGAEFGPLLAADRFAFSATDRVTTDVILMDASGHLLKRRTLNRQYAFIPSARKHNGFQMVGVDDVNESSDGDVHSFIMNMDSNFEETRRVASRLDKFTGSVFGSDDGYTAAGSYSHVDGLRYISVVLSADMQLEHKQPLELPRNRPPFLGGGLVMAAAQGRKPGELIVARSLVEVTVNAPSAPPKFRGAVIDFVNVH